LADLVSLKDRSNIANARVAGMQTDLKISDYQVSHDTQLGTPEFIDFFFQYSVALTVTYV
jgi:hypothetical protein